MKKYLFMILAAFAFAACSNTESNEGFGSYGETDFDQSAAIAANQVSDALGEAESAELVVKGTVTSVCQTKGCWMKMDLGNGEAMRVTFKDYGFLVPMNASGEEVVIQGTAAVSETSVAMLKEYAKDAEKSQEEIDAITEPERDLSFVATGVVFL